LLSTIHKLVGCKRDIKNREQNLLKPLTKSATWKAKRWGNNTISEEAKLPLYTPGKYAGGSKGVAPLILNLSTRGKYVLSLTSRQSPRNPLTFKIVFNESLWHH
jgi:hypothetical protein